MTRENTVERRLVRAVERVGGICDKFTSPARTGVPDRVCQFPNGRVAWVEVKAPGGRLSERQKVEVDRIRAHGGTVFVVWDEDGIDSVVEWGVGS